MGQTQLMSYKTLEKLEDCKSNFFLNAYIEKIKISFIDPHIQRKDDNPLDTLLQVEEEFKMKKKESKIVKDLRDYCLNKWGDKHKEKNFIQATMNNP